MSLQAGYDISNLYVGDILGSGCPEQIRGLLVSDIISHQVGLGSPNALQARLQEDPLFFGSLEFAPHRGVAAYADFAGWAILEAVVASLSVESSAAVAVRRVLLEPLGLSENFLFGPTDAEQLAVPVGGLPDRQFPFLSELQPEELARNRPALGAWSNAIGLGRLTKEVGTALTERVHPTLPILSAAAMRLFECRRETQYDQTLRRECAFVGGFMWGLHEHLFPVPQDSITFGHSAGYSAAFAFHDLDQDLTLSVVGNAAVTDSDSLQEFRTNVIAAAYAR
jgi:hypothetical protein